MIILLTVPTVADPVQYQPDPANHNFKNRIHILLPLTHLESIHLIHSTSNFFLINQINSDFFFYLKNVKNCLKVLKSLYFFLLVYTT